MSGKISDTTQDNFALSRSQHESGHNSKNNSATSPPRRVRMIDVADAAGVSRTTASFVLNGRDYSIPEETRQKVLNAATRMGYTPNPNAVALATGRTGRIGIVLNDPDSFDATDPYFGNVLVGVTRGALKNNYNLLFHSTRHSDWKALQKDILSPSSDGILLIARHSNDPLTLALLEAKFPTACISYRVDHPLCGAVAPRLGDGVGAPSAKRFRNRRGVAVAQKIGHSSAQALGAAFIPRGDGDVAATVAVQVAHGGRRRRRCGGRRSRRT